MLSDQKLFPIVDVPAGHLDSASPAALPRPFALFGLSRPELTALVSDLGQPLYRARQIEEALYRQWISDFDSVSTLPKNLRQALREAGYQVGLPEIVQTFRSVDGTERYLIAGLDGQTVETV